MALTTEQLIARRTMIGASEIAALAGLSKWKSPMQIFENKRLGRQEDPDENLPAELGLLFEEPIATVYRRRTKKLTSLVDTIRHPQFQFAGCTPDRAVFLGATPDPQDVKRDPDLKLPLLRREHLADAERLCQIKSTTYRMAKEWGTPGTDEVPYEYLLQEIWEMGVTGVKTADVAVLFDKDRFEIYTVYFDQKMFDGMYAIAERFMVDHVLTGIPPAPDGTEEYNESLRRVFSDYKAESYPLAPAEIGETVARFAMLKRALKAMAQGLELYKGRICYVIGQNEGLEGPFGKFTWKTVKDSIGVDWEACAREAMTMCGLMLHQFGDLMKAEDREQLTKTFRELIASHRGVVRRGGRRLNAYWSDDFERTLDEGLSGPLDMSAVFADIKALQAQAPSADQLKELGERALDEEGRLEEAEAHGNPSGLPKPAEEAVASTDIDEMMR